MLEILTGEGKELFSLILLIVVIGSFFSTIQIMKNEPKITEENLSFRDFILFILFEFPPRNPSALLLMGSSYWLYCQILGLSRENNVNVLMSYLLIWGGFLVIMMFLLSAAKISQWLNLRETD